MSDGADSPESGITSDNIHLSRPILPVPQITSDDNCSKNSFAGCADPKILEFIAAATAENTRRAYQRDLRHFLAWRGTVPASPELVAAYLAAHAPTLSMATLARRVIAIRRAHALHGLPDPTKTELVRLTLRGVRRIHGRPQRRVAPLRLEHLSAVVSVLSGSTRDVRDRALLLIGFAGAFRRSELSAVNYNQMKRIEQGIEITLPRSKTDQEGRGRRVAIPCVGGPICPVSALEAWLQIAKITDGPLFRRVDKSGKIFSAPLSSGAVATIVKERAAQIGPDPKNYSGHSLRAGFATCAAAAGLSAWDIKRQTGHVSDAILGRYIREFEQFGHMAAIWTGNSEGLAHPPGQPSRS